MPAHAIQDPAALIAEHGTTYGARVFAVAGTACLVVVLLGASLPPHLRAVLLALLGLGAGAQFWRDGTRRLRLFRDRLALLQGSRVREIAFREIVAWSIPLDEAIRLTLRGGETLRLSRWRGQANLNASLVTAIRVAACARAASAP